MPQQPRLGPQQQTPLPFVQMRQQDLKPHGELAVFPFRKRRTRSTGHTAGSDGLFPYGSPL